MDLLFEIFFYFLFIIPGFFSVWSFHKVTNKKRPSDFEYLIFSIFSGIVLLFIYELVANRTGQQIQDMVEKNIYAATIFMSFFGTIIGIFMGLFLKIAKLVNKSNIRTMGKYHNNTQEETANVISESNKEMIQEIQSKTQFVITIIVFFLAVLQNFYKIHNDEVKASDIFLKYSLVVVFYLVFYLLFEWRKTKINTFCLNKIRYLLILGIFFFIITTFTIIAAGNSNSAISLIYVYVLYPISLWGIFIVPTILMFGLPIEFLYRKFHKFGIDDKTEKELFWSEIFIHYINQLGGFDYKAVPYSTETIDVKGISLSRKYPELNMQLTWVKEIEFNPKKPANELLFKREDIEEAITRKTDKHIKRADNISNIILLLQGYMPRIWAKDILTDDFCNQFKSNPFKGIYYLVRPTADSEGKENPKDGDVLPIKICQIG